MKPTTTQAEIHRLITEITGTQLTEGDQDEAVLQALQEYQRKTTLSSKNSSRIMECIDVLQAYARLEFDAKVRLHEKGDHLNALAIGINMLGEELNQSTISLREKETLLREVHHRVKNNLQIISSLLSLQNQRPNTVSAEEVLREARTRIRSIALVHEQLYNNQNLAGICMREYIRQLADQVRSIYDPEQQSKFTVEVGEALFDLDTVIPLGLVVNELVSNAFKHAHRDPADLQIELSLHNSEQQYVLRVDDNGSGLPADFNPEESDSLGLNLVYMLSEQMEGDFAMGRSKHGGASMTLSFIV